MLCRRAAWRQDTWWDHASAQGGQGLRHRLRVAGLAQGAVDSAGRNVCEEAHQVKRDDHGAACAPGSPVGRAPSGPEPAGGTVQRAMDFNRGPGISSSPGERPGRSLHT